jgi:hypothetical protein
MPQELNEGWRNQIYHGLTAVSMFWLAINPEYRIGGNQGLLRLRQCCLQLLLSGRLFALNRSVD